MKLLKYIFLLLIVVSIGAAVYIATLPGSYHFQETRIMEAPQDLVYTTVNELTSWKTWHPDFSTNTTITQFAPKTQGQGASFSWKSSSLYDGRLETTKTLPRKAIDQKITVDLPFPGELLNGDMYWELSSNKGRNTKVIWGLRGEHSFRNRFFWKLQKTTLEALYRPKLQAGLAQMETLLQEKMNAYTVKVDGLTTHGGGFYMYSSMASSLSTISEKVERIYPQISSYMEQNSIPVLGSPFVIYNSLDQTAQSTIFSACIPTRDRVVTPADSSILCGFMEEQEAVKTTLRGNYSHLQEAWQATYDYISTNALSISDKAPPFEIYSIGPGQNPNPAEWVTEIYIPVKPTVVPKPNVRRVRPAVTDSILQSI